MKHIRLSKRLEKISQYAKENQNIFDIGSNHAYLPIYLMQKKQIPNAIASEINNGPYKQALEEVKKYNFENKIDVRLGNGFSPLKKTESPGTIFICGMGSRLIEKILKQGMAEGKLSNKSRLVLQANRNEKNLRIFLTNHKYKIIAENILEENNKIYEIIVAEKTENYIRYSEKELLFGPILLQNKNEVFIKKWQEKLLIFEKIFNRNENRQELIEIEKNIELIRKVLA